MFSAVLARLPFGDALAFCVMAPYGAREKMLPVQRGRMRIGRGGRRGLFWRCYAALKGLRTIYIIFCWQDHRQDV